MNENGNGNRQGSPEEQPAISQKKRKALITYLASLLILALLLVVLSMVIENNRRKDSNSGTASDAGSALANAEQLLEDNHKLSAAIESTKQAYDLLLRAQAAQLTGETEEFAASMSELADMRPYLSKDGQDQYDALLALLPPATD